MKLYGLTGYPIQHSFSKKYFDTKFEKEGINDAVYELFPAATAANIATIFLQSNLKGLNVTIPYKQAILSFLDDVSNIPATINACNCVKIANGKKIGYNTDIIGFEKSFLPHLKQQQTKALLLGNGGAAAAVKFVLAKNNIPFTIASRTLKNGVCVTYDEIDESIIVSHTIIINTTPVGTFPSVHQCPPIPYQHITDEHFLYDLVYNPEKTLFLQKGEEQGAAIKNGYEMLVLQAEESWRIWNED